MAASKLSDTKRQVIEQCALGKVSRRNGFGYAVEAMVGGRWRTVTHLVKTLVAAGLLTYDHEHEYAGGTPVVATAEGRKLVTVQQFGARWSTGIVFSYGSREDAEADIQRKPPGAGVLMVHEGVPGATEAEWTPWVEVRD